MNRDIELMKLCDFTERERKEYEKGRVEFRKTFSRISAEVRRASKDEKCAICNKPLSSFCNSHSIPAMCLRSIAEDGQIYRSSKLLDMPLIDNELGVNNAGTFSMICRECDQHYFQDYEDPEALTIEPTQKIMCEIALKNYLKAEFISRNSKNTYITLMEQRPDMNFREMINVEELDAESYRCEQRSIVNQLGKINNSRVYNDVYSLLYFDLLNYVSPVSLQNRIALVCDFEGKMINDIYNLSPKYKMQDVHICIFPLANTTAIIVFSKYEDTRYRSFRKQFRKLQKSEKLSVINYITLSYSEEFYYSPIIQPLIASDETLKNAVNKTSNPVGTRTVDCDMKALHELVSKTYDLSEHSKLTNLLDSTFQVIPPTPKSTL